MRTRALFVILFFYVMSAFAKGADERVLGDVVEINLGMEWSEEQRDSKFLNRLCPIHSDDDKVFFISNINMETRTLGCVDYEVFGDKVKDDEKDEKRNEVGVLNVSSQSIHNFNISEIDNPAKSVSDIDDESDDYSKKLQTIVKNANGYNNKIYPLAFKNIRGFIWSAPLQDGRDPSRPFVGFLGIGNSSKEPTDKNYIMQTLGVKKNIYNNAGMDMVGAIAKKSSPEILNTVIPDNDLASWGDIGFSIGSWIDNYNFNPNNNPSVKTIKEQFFNWKADDSKQTWARVMTGVTVLDDSYIKQLNERGELVVNNAMPPIVSRKGFSAEKDTKKYNNLFEQTSDGKLWGFYVYLTQNLHSIEILLILALAGVTFGGSMVSNIATWIQNAKQGAQASTIVNWRQAIFTPMLGVMCIAVPIVPSNTQLFKDFILDTNTIASEIQLNQLNVKNTKQYDENAFYTTGLQWAIQSMATYGSFLADIFSHKVTFAFSSFISFRKNAITDPRPMLHSWKREYNTISRDMIYLNEYLQFYLSTCKNDYSQASDKDKILNSTTILPNMLNIIDDNRLVELQRKVVEDTSSNILALKFGDSRVGVATAQTCAKIETEIFNRSEPLMRKMFNLSREVTDFSNRQIDNAGYIPEKSQELLQKIKRLAFYERTYGWVNTAMLPIMYQILFPSFNPYKFDKKVKELGSYSENYDKSTIDLLHKQYFIIGKPTTTNNISNQLDNNNPIATSQAGENDKSILNKIMNFGLSLVVYQYLPGFGQIEQQISALYKSLGADSGKTDSQGNSIKRPGKSSFVMAFLLALIADDNDLERSGDIIDNPMSWLGGLGAIKAGSSSLTNIIDRIAPSINKAASMFGIDAQALSDFLILKIVSQMVYIYTLNLLIMVIISLVLVYKVGMYFLQLIIFYMASPLVVIWSLMQRRQEYILTYIGKASVLILSPVLIVISTSVLLLGVGIIQEIYAIIANHALNIQIIDVNTDMESVVNTATGAANGLSEKAEIVSAYVSNFQDYIQIQMLIGIGNVLVGFSYLFLGYVIIIKFTGWFFETIGIQTNNMITQSLDSIGQRMTFGRSFMA